MLYTSQTKEVKLVWRFVCGNVHDDQPVRTVLRMFILIRRANRRIRQYDSYTQNLHDGYHPYLPTIPPTYREESLVAAFLPDECLDCVIQDPSITGRTINADGLTIVGDANDFDPTGHKIKGTHCPINQLTDNALRKHPLVLGNPTHAYGSLLQANKVWYLLRKESIPKSSIPGITAYGRLEGFHHILGLITNYREFAGPTEAALWKRAQLPLPIVVTMCTFPCSQDSQTVTRRTQAPPTTRIHQLKEIMSQTAAHVVSGVDKFIQRWKNTQTISPLDWPSNQSVQQPVVTHSSSGVRTQGPPPSFPAGEATKASADLSAAGGLGQSHSGAVMAMPEKKKKTHRAGIKWRLQQQRKGWLDPPAVSTAPPLAEVPIEVGTIQKTSSGPEVGDFASPLLRTV